MRAALRILGASTVALLIAMAGASLGGQTAASGSTPTPTKTLVLPTPNEAVFGQPVTLHVTVSAIPPGTGTPTGEVRVKVGRSDVIGTVHLSDGSATLTTSSIPVDFTFVTGLYLGAADFAPSHAPAARLAVFPAHTTTALEASSSTSVLGEPVTFTATVSAVAPGSGTPMGDVTFKDGANVIETVPLSSGAAALLTDGLGRGTHTITARYHGSDDFTSSASAALTHVVTR